VGKFVDAIKFCSDRNRELRHRQLFQRDRPLVIAIVATMPLFVLPPLLHRVNDYAAMLSIAVINGAALALLAYIVGTAAGVHFFLFAAPAAIVFFGPHHVRVAAFITVCT
jgi:hypothetical protein